MKKSFYTYMLITRKNTALYTGVTSDLIKRTYDHKQGAVQGHTKKYSINKLVYFEGFDDPENAIKREKEIKGWRREKKIALIESENPEYRDLYEDICS